MSMIQGSVFETLKESDLQDPVGAADKAREAQRKHVVRRELFDHLGLLHHAQLRQHRNSLHIHARGPHDLQTTHAEHVCSFN